MLHLKSTSTSVSLSTCLFYVYVKRFKEYNISAAQMNGIDTRQMLRGKRGNMRENAEKASEWHFRSMF